MSGETGAAKEFVAEKGITFTNLLGDWAMARRLYGVTSTPATFLIDRRGRVIFFHSGFNPKSGPAELATEVEELLAR